MYIKNIYFLLAITLILLVGCKSESKNNVSETNNETIKIILETDIGNDVDDALALDMLYKYLDARKIELLGININKEGNYPPEFVDIMNTWYGYPNIPIGVVRNGADCETDALNYAKAVCLIKDKDGKVPFKHTLNNYNGLPDAHTLYRRILSSQPDNSVIIVSVGFSTNLARLLETQADEISPLTGKELVAKKVKLLCTMAGCFNNPDLHEYNVVKDIPAAQKVFSEWPTPLVTSPFEVGIAINYPGKSIENDFNWTSIHPMVEAYKSYQKMPYDRPTWDLTSVLYAVEGSKWFTLSPLGDITVDEKGGTIFTPNEKGNRRYFTVDSIQAETIKSYFVNLITKKPKNK